jgi:subfamily B ATP-binding cassette protein MsbA
MQVGKVMSRSTDKKKVKLQKDDLQTFYRLLSFAKPYFWRLVIGSVCSVLGGGSILAILLTGKSLIGFIIESPTFSFTEDVPAMEASAFAVDEAGEMVPDASAPAETEAPATDVSGTLFSKFISDSDLKRLEQQGVSSLLTMSGVLMLLILINSLATFGSVYYLQWVGQRIVMDLRVKLFSHLQKLSISFYNTSSSGDMISRAIADTQLLQNSVTNIVIDAIRQPITFLVVLGYVLVDEWQLALFSVVFFPAVIVPIVLIGRRLRRISREGQRCLADLTSVMKESLDGVVVVKAFGQEAREEARFDEQCRKFFHRMVSAAKAKALNDPITHIIGGIGGVGVLVYALIAKMPIKDCIIFACAIWAMYEPVKKIGRIFMEIQQSSAPADRIFEIIDAPVTISDSPDAVEISDPLQHIEFRNIAFNYGTKDVFTNLNLKIENGTSLAVVGPSGGGKTTLVGLLMRFFDPISGEILRNGEDIRKYTMKSVRANIGFVMQDTFLFNSTIADNIAYGNPEATREEIENAAKLAHAHEFILEKEEGYDTVVGERGVSLSGGQKQRIAIARALLRNPGLLILDEATSALDTESERNVQAAIEGLMGRMTMIVIAHRLSTIVKCDYVAVVANGGIAEFGTHAELLAKRGLYTRLHELQFGSCSNGTDVAV